jgi:hypothetical protein
MGNATLSLNLERMIIQSKNPEAYRINPMINFAWITVWNIERDLETLLFIAIFRIISPDPLHSA